jgi:hypothetical protein
MILGGLGRIWRDSAAELEPSSSTCSQARTRFAWSPSTPPSSGRRRYPPIAQELRRRCDLQQRDTPFFLQDFVDRYEGRYHDVQLPLPIAWSDRWHSSTNAGGCRDQGALPGFISPGAGNLDRKV